MTPLAVANKLVPVIEEFMGTLNSDVDSFDNDALIAAYNIVLCQSLISLVKVFANEGSEDACDVPDGPSITALTEDEISDVKYTKEQVTLNQSYLQLTQSISEVCKSTASRARNPAYSLVFTNKHRALYQTSLERLPPSDYALHLEITAFYVAATIISDYLLKINEVLQKITPDNPFIEQCTQWNKLLESLQREHAKSSAIIYLQARKQPTRTLHYRYTHGPTGPGVYAINERQQHGNYGCLRRLAKRLGFA